MGRPTASPRIFDLTETVGKLRDGDREMVKLNWRQLVTARDRPRRRNWERTYITGNTNRTGSAANKGHMHHNLVIRPTCIYNPKLLMRKFDAERP